MAPDGRIGRAKELYLEGRKLAEIARELGLPEGTVRRWKHTYGWGSERTAGGTKAPKRKRGAQPGNKNSKGGPPGNRKAEKYGFFSKYLPEETREIFTEIESADPLELLWHQIQFAYTAIIRAQRIMYVKSREEKGACVRQDAFMSAQARAQKELRSMIRQYDEMVHKDWAAASEEQKARLEQIRAQTARASSGAGRETDDGVEIINDCWEETGEGGRPHHPEVPGGIQ